MLSVCTSIFSPFPSFLVFSRHLLQLLFPSHWSEHLHPNLIFIASLYLCCSQCVSLSVVSLPLSAFHIQPPFLLYFSLESPSSLPRFCLAALPGCHSNRGAKQLSSAMQSQRLSSATLNTVFSSSVSCSLSDDSVYINSKDKYSINKANHEFQSIGLYIDITLRLLQCT